MWRKGNIFSEKRKDVCQEKRKAGGRARTRKAGQFLRIEEECPACMLWGVCRQRIFSRMRPRYFFMPSASRWLMMSSSFFSSTRMPSTWTGVRGLKRISCSR